MVVKDENQAKLFEREHMIEKRMKDQQKKYREFERKQHMKLKEDKEKYKEWTEKHNKALKSVYEARRTDDNQAFLEYKRKIKADRESRNRLETE